MTKYVFEGGRGRRQRDYKLEFVAQLAEAKIPVEPEYRFAPPRLWTFDWRVVGMKLAIEYEGGMYGKKGARRCPVCKQLPKGAHFAIGRIKSDAEKYNEAAARGWCVIRILPHMVVDGSGIRDVRRAVMLRKHMKGERDAKTNDETGGR